MDYAILDAAARHLPQVERLEQRCFSVPWTEAQLRAQLPDDRHVFLVAERGDEVLGYVGLMHVLDEGYISNVAVSPDCRRQGIGAALIAELTRRAGRLELAFLTLEARASNAPAIRLYEKMGFRQVGRRKRYYQRPEEDAVLMTLFLR
ncbi:MAG: ribosomal protein S18-alanine N-acetyltransferase [Oscillospiraceae bacterium]|mgnify:FL=1|nr:ribosomal protein S18-alanine N-acetyltransferase [Oscillospiraceae bacterium]MDY6095509.1 ribosomal protein S18-alanine N-acetyltransferase [Oscillospiraceae bacterium]